MNAQNAESLHNEAETPTRNTALPGSLTVVQFDLESGTGIAAATIAKALETETCCPWAKALAHSQLQQVAHWATTSANKVIHRGVAVEPTVRAKPQAI